MASSATGISSPYGSYGGTEISNKNGDDGEIPSTTVFRNWSHSSTNSTSPTNLSLARREVLKLDEETTKLRAQLHELREHGRQIRLHRLQALDALETRRVTLTEILRRMEKELNERDVFIYGDVLAEVFGERKIFAHRAVGLEALLCQYMHQMLAKQHQLKIMKQAGKDIQSHYKKHRLQNKDDYYSYEALAVQVEASRLSLEAVYDDIFASQHSLLAKLKHVESGGNMTNYSIPTASHKQKNCTNDQTQLITPQKNVPASSMHSNDAEQQDSNITKGLFSPSPDDDLEDITAAINLLTVPNIPLAESTNSVSIPSFRTTTTETLSTRMSESSKTLLPAKTSSKLKFNAGAVKSARERRREIEQMRLARLSHASRPSPSSAPGAGAGGVGGMARSRLRELEAVAVGSAATSYDDDDNDDGDDDDGDGELHERRGTRGKVVSSA